jgi:two-component system sensor histidine kinase MtrB
MRSIRTRLALAFVSLVVVTVAAIGVGVYLFVDASLRDGLVADARRQADFNLSVLLPAETPRPANAAEFAASGLPEAFRLRGDVETIADFGDGNPYTPGRLLGALDDLAPELRTIVAGGQLGYAWQELGGDPVLVVGGLQDGPPELYFVFPAGGIETALGQLRLGLLSGGLLAILVALVVAGMVSRAILRPVDEAARAARRIADGDLSARVPGHGADEFGRWAAEFNRMAETLEATVGRLDATVVRLDAAQQQNRRFVADVSHELRTPLTALVAEASLLESALSDLPPGSRRAAELLVTDVRRLRALVDDLMEMSRFDAQAEQANLEELDLGRVVAAIVAARLPGAAVSLPAHPVPARSDPRRLDRILGNLLDNAREHGAGSPVEVSMSQTAEGAVIVVADRGPGVPPDALPHLFDRFYKADPSRGAGGSGLGLAIAAEHAALLGATLRARARPGGGLVFALTLPVTASLPMGERDDTDEVQADGASEPAPDPRP